METGNIYASPTSLNSLYASSEEQLPSGSFSTSTSRVVETRLSTSPSRLRNDEGRSPGGLASNAATFPVIHSPQHSELPPILDPSNISRGPSLSSANYALDYLHNRYRKLPNRQYYPSLHHQAQFDSLDSSTLRHLELVGLNSLDGDVEQPPMYAMPLIIECAILGSPHQRLTLSELRVTLKKRFRYYEKEEEKGVKSWERTLLQNLSKKERFVNIERPEPGQGGYWAINPDAPPSNRARKRISRQRLHSPVSLSRPEPTWLSGDPSVTTQDFASKRELGGPSSRFPSFPTDRYPDGKLKGRHPLSIRLPQVPPKPQEHICPSSPRYWLFSEVSDPHTSSNAPQRPSHGQTT